MPDTLYAADGNSTRLNPRAIIWHHAALAQELPCPLVLHDKTANATSSLGHTVCRGRCLPQKSLTHVLCMGGDVASDRDCK